MNRIFHHTLILLGLLGVVTSCNEDPEYFKLEDRPDTMHIQASAERLMLEKAKEDETAITFRWDAAGSPVSASDPVTYAMRIYATANKSLNTTGFYELGPELEMGFTHDELNAIISDWVLPGEEISLTAQVISTVHNENRYVKPMSSTVEFTVSGYEKYPAYIYIHMTDGAGETEVYSLTQRNMNSGIYEGTFDMVPCRYYFTTRYDSEYPAYTNAGDGEHLRYVNEGDYETFENTETGRRTIVLDTNNAYNDCRMIEIIQYPGTLRIVGDGCTIGWDLSNSEGLFKVEDARNPQFYSWTGNFFAGKELKIGTGPTYHADYFFFAPEQGADPLVNHELPMYRMQDYGGDVKWIPSVSGRYRFTLCLEAGNMHTDFVPVD